MVKPCRTVRADTDFKQILRWSRCGPVSHRRVPRRMHAPTDLQQLQDLKMFGPWGQGFVTVWFDTGGRCRVETTMHVLAAELPSL